MDLDPTRSGYGDATTPPLTAMPMIEGVLIPHHQSAIDVARIALEQAGHPEVRELAQAIIDAQQREIDEMTAWREAWYPEE